ncbi:hypothetical protein [Bacteroides sp.]
MGLAESKLLLLQEAMSIDSIDKVEEAIEMLQAIKRKGQKEQPPCSCSWEENAQIIIDRINKFDEVGGIPADEVHKQCQKLIDSWSE